MLLLLESYVWDRDEKENEKWRRESEGEREND
jgi:hypothetical protein